MKRTTSLWSLALSRPGRTMSVAAFSLAMGILGWGVAWLVQTVIDRAGAARGAVALAAAGVGAAALLRAAAGVVRRRLQVSLVHDVERRLVLDYVGHLLVADMKGIGAFSTGDLYRRVRGLDLIRFALEERVYGALFDVVLVIVAAGVLLFYSVSLTAVAILGALIPAVVVFLSRHAIVRSSKAHHEEDSRLTHAMMDALRGLRDLRLTCGESWMTGRLDSLLGEYHRGRFRHLLQLGRLQALTGFLGAAAGIFVLWLGSEQVGAGMLTLGQLMFVFTLAGLLLNPLEQLAASWFAIREASVVLARYDEVLNLPQEESGGGLDALDIRSGLRVEEIGFAYEPGRPVLAEVSFEVPAGSVLAVVGESGAGKSTLLSLLAGLHAPDRGRILVDGRDIREIGLGSWRRVLGVVPQSPHLFEATLAENIGLGCPMLAPESLGEAVRVARARKFIDALPEGLSTVAAHEGGAFSAGQVQRIAIARALAGDPKILLLDEATNNLDAETEAGIWDSLARSRGQRTVIFVTHRLATSVLADRIIVLDGGRIAEEGRWRDLVSRDGPYRRLWLRQNPMLDDAARSALTTQIA
jgi:subfamily B ATP-binding cassette protein HlyB/CyaB